MWMSDRATLSNISLRKGTIGKEEQSCKRYIHANIKLAGKNIPRKWHSGITRGSNTPYGDVFLQHSNDYSVPITYPPIFYNFSEGGSKGTSRHAGKGPLLDFLHGSFVCYVWALPGSIFSLRPIDSIKRQIYLLTPIKDSKNIRNQLILSTFSPLWMQIGSRPCFFLPPFCSRFSPFVLIK